MNRLWSLALLILLLPALGYAQARRIVVRDADRHNPIAQAIVCDSLGRYLACTDNLGRALVPRGAGLCQVSHIAYQNQSSRADTIELQERQYTIDALPVVGKMPAYIRLRSYVRIYQYIDSLPVNYVEGVVDYYSPTSKNKLSYDIKSLAVYRNGDAIRHSRLGAGSWDANNNGLMDWLLNEHISGQSSSDFQLVSQASPSSADTTTAGAEGLELRHRGKPYPFARIQAEGEQYAISVDLLGQEAGRRLKLFGRTATVVHRELFELFPRREAELLRPYDLRAYRWFTGLDVEYKGQALPIRNITELYILERKFISEAEFKAVKTSRYWGNLSASVLPQALAEYEAEHQGKIPARLQGIQQSLGQALQLLPPKP